MANQLGIKRKLFVNSHKGLIQPINFLADILISNLYFRYKTKIVIYSFVYRTAYHYYFYLIYLKINNKLLRKCVHGCILCLLIFWVPPKTHFLPSSCLFTCRLFLAFVLMPRRDIVKRGVEKSMSSDFRIISGKTKYRSFTIPL